ncbi:MAG: DUF6782 family putative metallopeptidase [Alphaproteobacteria bacterium]
MTPPNIFISSGNKSAAMINYAMHNKFFENVLYDLFDFGHNISFSLFSSTGAYQALSVSTEKIDTKEKQQQFAHSFLNTIEKGQSKAQLKFSAFSDDEINAHYFLHELMHFYQDMQGLYLLPIHEKGVFPTLLDAKSDVISILLCEAWAEVEAIRTSWALKENGHPQGWNGAITSPDWKDLAISYDNDLENGVDEAKAAANIFQKWYEGKHRKFYEEHALKIHKINLNRFKEGVENLNESYVTQSFRVLELPMLLARIPSGEIPNFFHQIDWLNPLYNDIKTQQVLTEVKNLERVYGTTDNPNIQEIKCGSPPYLWNRLRLDQQNNSEIPPR